MNDRSLWTRRTVLGTAGTAASLAALGPTASAEPAAPQRRSGAQGTLYAIRSGRHEVVVAGVAATLLSWRVDGAEQLLTHSGDVLGEGYQGKTIMPWPNRIENGRYTFDGAQLQAPINEPTRSAALHGLTSFVEWEHAAHERDHVVLEHELHPRYGYPFHLRLRVEYTVDDEGVRSSWQVRNLGVTDAPFGTANHTYVAAARGTIDEIDFALPADTYYLTDENLIPTGTESVAGTEYDFRAARPLGSTVMDTAFTGLARQEDGTAVVRFVRPGGPTIELWVDEAHGYLQVYTDDAPEDHAARSGITVEPMTCAPNAFVTGDGLLVLAPDETARGSWGLRVDG